MWHWLIPPLKMTLWNGHVSMIHWNGGILLLICVWQRDRDVTGEGQGWRNGHGWGGEKSLTLLCWKSPSPFKSHHVNVIGEKISLHLSRGHGKWHPPIRRGVDCYICLTARGMKGSMALNVWVIIKRAQVEKDGLTGHMIKIMMQLQLIVDWTKGCLFVVQTQGKCTFQWFLSGIQPPIGI